MKRKVQDSYFTGIDIGSTTAKVAIISNNGNIIFSRYRRHLGDPLKTVKDIFKEALEELGDVKLNLKITGSAGMGIAERLNLPFVQEVVASANYIQEFFPETKTFIEIGGEDSKIIFFDEKGRPDIRMNGSCAGGTGAFIDQMAVLLNVDVSEIDKLAGKSTKIYPIASRCGVFAKTDIQALLSRRVSKEDIAASVFHSVALQVITTLSRGKNIEKKILFGGGPLTFYSNLRKAFIKVLNIDQTNDIIIPDHPELIPALGVAAIRENDSTKYKISEFLSGLEKRNVHITGGNSERLPSLFSSKSEFEEWQKRHSQNKVRRIELSEAKGKELFLGIDSGSTTTKMVIIDDKGRLVLSYYTSNNGDPIQAVKDGFSQFKEKFNSAGYSPNIVRTAATGYGESLIKAAFGLDDGVVETMAHYQAARHFAPDVSFILDIGGQDMKAIFIKDNAVTDIQINEACSSGCGSFIETFGRSLGYNVQDFSKIACQSNSPFDLGTRCTVFMNSKVKQALREGATVPDISAGLAYSVIKNALFKVLKLKDLSTLGDKIVVQGGTFKNPAVLRALELLLNKEVVRPDISELMGAYGAALIALENYRLQDNSILEKSKVSQIPVLPKMQEATHDWFTARLEMGSNFTKKEIQCKGCENKCTVTKLTFSNKNHFYSGNRCERYFSNNPDIKDKGKNLIEYQKKLLFERKMEPDKKPILTYGIPRCLNMYENFPFWCAFLTTCGFKVVLSSESNFKLYNKGAGTIMSENICLPSKLAHGHIFDLAEKKVDRIFYPTVVFEREEYQNALNTYNCPVVTGYPDLLASAVNPEKRFGIPLDKPAISFKDLNLLKHQLYRFFKQFGVDYKTITKGIEEGIKAQIDYKSKLKSAARNLLAEAEKQNKKTVVLAGRPYHIDPLINHGIPNLLTELGVNVISENAVPIDNDEVSLKDVNVLTQWSYTNRLYAAARWVTTKPNVELVQLTSFGCGPDAISTDEVKEILRSGGKIHTLIKIDEITNLGAVKIRLRSMLEAVKGKNNKITIDKSVSKTKENKKSKKVIITPYFSSLYSPIIPYIFKPYGYKLEVLPPQDKESVEYGLKLINNDMCYPSILVAGDIIKAFKSGLYDPENTAVILTQTGGQCRASSYVSLIKKGLSASGLDNVPIITLSGEGFKGASWLKIDDKIGLLKRMALAVIFSDPLVRMYLPTVVREKIPGTSKKLHEKYLIEIGKGLEEADFDYLLSILQKAVEDFNKVDIKKEPVPRIGIVGEIFVNYNFFSNGNIVEWLSGQGIEVVLPPIQNFFSQRFVNETYDQKAYFKRSWADRFKHRVLEIYTKYHLDRIEKVTRNFRFYNHSHDLRELANITENVVSLANQFGEGWLLPAEMIGMLKNGINNIICIQPFGCISNHITGKGIENKLKELFPDVNLLFLDVDAGSSEVNLLNRIHFIIAAARKETTCKTETPAQENETAVLPVNSLFPQKLQNFNNHLLSGTKKVTKRLYRLIAMTK